MCKCCFVQGSHCETCLYYSAVPQAKSWSQTSRIILNLSHSLQAPSGQRQQKVSPLPQEKCHYTHPSQLPDSKQTLCDSASSISCLLIRFCSGLQHLWACWRPCSLMDTFSVMESSFLFWIFSLAIYGLDYTKKKMKHNNKVKILPLILYGFLIFFLSVSSSKPDFSEYRKETHTYTCYPPTFSPIHCTLFLWTTTHILMHCQQSTSVAISQSESHGLTRHFTGFTPLGVFSLP